MATFETKNVHITLLLGHWLQKSLKRIELWILKIKCNFIAPALIQQFFIALIFPCLDHYSAARPVPIVIRPIVVVLVTLSHISRSTCLRVQQLSKISNSRHVPGMVCYESKMPSVASSCYEGKFHCQKTEFFFLNLGLKLEKYLKRCFELKTRFAHVKRLISLQWKNPANRIKFSRRKLAE